MELMRVEEEEEDVHEMSLVERWPRPRRRRHMGFDRIFRLLWCRTKREKAKEWNEIKNHWAEKLHVMNGCIWPIVEIKLWIWVTGWEWGREESGVGGWRGWLPRCLPEHLITLPQCAARKGKQFHFRPALFLRHTVIKPGDPTNPAQFSASL